MLYKSQSETNICDPEDNTVEVHSAASQRTMKRPQVSASPDDLTPNSEYEEIKMLFTSWKTQQESSMSEILQEMRTVKQQNFEI